MQWLYGHACRPRLFPLCAQQYNQGDFGDHVTQNQLPSLCINLPHASLWQSASMALMPDQEHSKNFLSRAGDPVQ